MPAAAATAPPPGPGPSSTVPLQSHPGPAGNHYSSHASPLSGLSSQSQSSAPPPPAKNTSHVPCKFFRQHACQAGNSCPFSHSLDPVPPCKYFLKGNCKFGPKCANLHVFPDCRRPSMVATSPAGTHSVSGPTQSPPGNLSSPHVHVSRAHLSPVTPSLLSIHARHGQLGPNMPTPGRGGSGEGGIGGGLAGVLQRQNMSYDSYGRGVGVSSPYGLDSTGEMFPGSPPDSVIASLGGDVGSPHLPSRPAGSVPVPGRANGLSVLSSPPLPRSCLSIGRNRDRFAASQQAFMSASFGAAGTGCRGGTNGTSPFANLSSGKHLIAQESADADSDIDEILSNRDVIASASADGLPEFDDVDSAVMDDYDSDSEFRAEAFGLRRGSLLTIPPTPNRPSFSSIRQSSLGRPLIGTRPVSSSVRSVSLSTPMSANRFGIGSYTSSPAVPMSGASLRLGSPGGSSPVGAGTGSPSRFSQFFARPDSNPVAAVGLSTGPTPTVSASVTVPTNGTSGARPTPTSLRVASGVVGSPLRNQQFPSAGTDDHDPNLLPLSKLAISSSYADAVAGPVGLSGLKSELEDSHSRSSRTTDEEGAVFDME